MSKKNLSRSQHKVYAHSVSKVTGKELGQYPVTHEGCQQICEPYGGRTCSSYAANLDTGKKTGENSTLIVTYGGIFVTRGRGQTDLLLGCDPKDVTFVWQNEDDESQMSLIVHPPPPYKAFVHMLRLANAAETTVPDLVTLINTASQGPYPGALGVFSASYNGSVSVDKATGNEVVGGAVKRIKELSLEPRAVEIVITNTQIKVMDEESGTEIKVFSIIEVSFTAIDPKNSKKLSFITNDARFGLLYCHTFSVDDETQASQIPKTIGAAFKAVEELLKTAPRDELKALGLIPPSKGTSGAIGVFEVKHIGSVPSKESRGNATVEAGLKLALQQNHTAESIILIISEDGIRSIDGLTGEVTNSVFIQHVSFITTIGEKKNVFGFISEDARLKRRLVHVYDCVPAVALRITKAVGASFKIVGEKLKEEKLNKNKNPFRAVSKEREAVPGKLFKCQLHRADIKPGKVIGAGQFGQVYLATYRKDTKVAVKTVRLAASDDDKDDFVHEAEVMLDLETEGLVSLIGVCVQQRPWLCVIEFMQYGDLRDVVQTCKERNFKISLLEQLKMVLQICAGLKFMASRRYIHMDIAARNCLLAENNVCKLADFGLTQKLDPGTNRYLLKKTAKLPVRWVAIEALETGVFSQASDVWAFGVLIWEILSYGELPFAAVSNINVQKEVKRGLRLQPPPGASRQLFAIAQSCWTLPKKRRPLFNPIYERLNGLKDSAIAESVPERDIGAACQEHH